MNTLSQPETESILTLCLIASFADGDKHVSEHEQFKKITESLSNEKLDISGLYRKVLLNKPDIAEVAARLESPAARLLAYEMAVCVCDADDVCNAAEQKFLDELRSALALPDSTARPIEAEATALATQPITSPEAADAPVQAQAPALAQETDGMIMRYAIVGGALELLPQTMATLAIIPMQIKMVYRIGSQSGITLDRKSIVELMAALGIGMASQVVEGFARRLTRSLGKSLGGKMGGKIGDAVGGMITTFGTTYALGQIAKMYYHGGRSLSMESLKAKYPPLLSEGKALAEKYSSQITQKSQQLNGASMATLLKGVI